MKPILQIISLLLLTLNSAFAQHDFNYNVVLKPITIDSLPGLHSFAYGQHDGKWVILGGRRDGLHARQPFASFPENQNNKTIYVVDAHSKKVWSASITGLAQNIQEQLQSTNMNFHQIADTLYIVGGYAYSQSKKDHITYPFLSTITVSSLIDQVINGKSLNTSIKQIEDSIFAVCGGQLKALDNKLYLVGGQKFTGRYNPMGHNTYVQQYTNQIRSFTVNNTGSMLSFGNYTVTTDPIHLHRRDYNLLPQINPDGTKGLMISSGVFQLNADLPFLYPVNITSTGYSPITSFNQYLSHYHSAHTSLFDSSKNMMHMLFFGGMSQYFYQDTTLIKDDQVPFVKTISRLSRNSKGELKEFQMESEMPELIGASAEFILNPQISHTNSDIIKLSSSLSDSLHIGHIVGGIYSPTKNPFGSNQSSSTKAHSTLYEVILAPDGLVSSHPIKGDNPYQVTFTPNPVTDCINLTYQSNSKVSVEYFITSSIGQLIQSGTIAQEGNRLESQRIQLNENIPNQVLYVTLVFDSKFFVSERLLKH